MLKHDCYYYSLLNKIFKLLVNIELWALTRMILLEDTIQLGSAPPKEERFCHECAIWYIAGSGHKHKKGIKHVNVQA